MKLVALSLYLLQAQSEKSSFDWGMFGGIVAVGALLVSIVIGILQLRAAQPPTKAIKCVIVSSTPLVKVDTRLKNDLQVLYKGKAVQDATSVILRISNSGKLPIARKDFDRPITFIFAQSSEILSAEVVKTEPKGLGAQLQTTNNNIELQPLLLNSRDSVDIAAIVSSLDNNINIDGRIENVTRVRLEREETVVDVVLDYQRKLQTLVTFLALVSMLATMANSGDRLYESLRYIFSGK
jgi:hypothetical protein